MMVMKVNDDEGGGEKNCCDQYYFSMTPICSVIRFRIRKWSDLRVDSLSEHIKFHEATEIWVKRGLYEEKVA